MLETEITDSLITFDGVYTSEYAPKDKGIVNGKSSVPVKLS
jgi:hypothetical protein